MKNEKPIPQGFNDFIVSRTAVGEGSGVRSTAFEQARDVLIKNTLHTLTAHVERQHISMIDNFFSPTRPLKGLRGEVGRIK